MVPFLDTCDFHHLLFHFIRWQNSSNSVIILLFFLRCLLCSVNDKLTLFCEFIQIQRYQIYIACFITFAQHLLKKKKKNSIYGAVWGVVFSSHMLFIETILGYMWILILFISSGCSIFLQKELGKKNLPKIPQKSGICPENVMCGMWHKKLIGRIKKEEKYGGTLIHWDSCQRSFDKR